MLGCAVGFGGAVGDIDAVDLGGGGVDEGEGFAVKKVFRPQKILSDRQAGGAIFTGLPRDVQGERLPVASAQRSGGFAAVNGKISFECAVGGDQSKVKTAGLLAGLEWHGVVEQITAHLRSIKSEGG